MARELLGEDDTADEAAAGPDAEGADGARPQQFEPQPQQSHPPAGGGFGPPPRM
ncbi:hypothetical protein GCM10020254_57010 [Streptomyces goshikiensis]